jgi:uncharacterized protein
VRLHALAAVVLLSALPALAAAREIPPLGGPVVDEAGVLSGAEVRRLDGLARAAREVEGRRGVQLQFLLVKSLDGEAIEDFAIRVAERWKLGDAARGNGVLLVAAIDDRKVRIEVGNGIEGGLTDAQASRIIRGAIAPAFRAGRYGEGLHQAAVEVLQVLGALPEGVRGRPEARAGRVGSRFGGLLMAGLVIVFIVIRAIFGLGRRGLLGGRGGWGGGGFGGGGFGGGGFGGSSGGGSWGGGGGGFSGGGASGSW